MTNLAPPIPGELRATIQVTRAATGKVETFEVVGHSDPDKLKELLAQRAAARVHGTVGAIVGPGPALNQEN